MIEKFYKKRDFFIEIARLYYIEKLNQKEIAAKFNISRSNISKLIKKCWQEGIIEIRIDNQDSKTLLKGSQLKRIFKLKHVTVVLSENNYQETLVSVGRKAARYLESILKENICIGIGWGTSLFQMVEQLNKKSVPGSTIVEMHGGLGARNALVDGNELGRALARKLNSSIYTINAPLVVRSKELKDLLCKEPNIAEVLALAEKADVAFLGIGTSKPEYSALNRAGFIDEKETDCLYKKGAVGMVCGYYYDSQGRLLNSNVNDRIISLSLEKLKNISLTIGVAAGEQKVDAILGALKGGYINALFTDEIVANKILEKKEYSSVL